MENLFGMKQCTKCKEIKSLDSFGIHHLTKDKLQTNCKICITNNRKEWKKNNPDKDKQIYLNKQSYYNQKSKDRYLLNREKILNKRKEYYQNNKEKIQNYYNQWVENNKEKIKTYQQNRKNNNPIIRLSSIMRSTISTGIRKYNGEKRKKALDIIGLKSWEEFKIYVESKWEVEMSWENYGVGKNNTTWHLDHIIPLHSATSVDDVLKLNHYTNLTPMWGSDNIRKGSKF
jgi:hypothetical protein